MDIKQTKFQGVYEGWKGKKKILLTRNAVPGKTAYDELLIQEQGIEYRTWDTRKSKLAAAIAKGIGNINIRPGSLVLYLGASTGTTVSHVSDIIGNDGFVFAIEFAARVARQLVFLAEQRKNIAPILADANKPELFYNKALAVDTVFQDIAQKHQVAIFIKNCDLFLKKGGFGILCVKARSIDVAKKPKEIFKDVTTELEKHYIIADYRDLEPFQLDHCIFVCKKK